MDTHPYRHKHSTSKHTHLVGVHMWLLLLLEGDSSGGPLLQSMGLQRLLRQLNLLREEGETDSQRDKTDKQQTNREIDG